ncbi:hypothetical protein GALL_105250 [mine drainage metagenome]|uniref:Uncharacterized protein n=1 Tax=mine drainage metagenome TaxID=410659 RepID=A0A1J5STB2_9ZZZZ
MKAISNLTLGLLSAAFLTLGFNRLAAALDPLTTATHAHDSELHTFSVIPTCSMPSMPPTVSVS